MVMMMIVVVDIVVIEMKETQREDSYYFVARYELKRRGKEWQMKDYS